MSPGPGRAAPSSGTPPGYAARLAGVALACLPALAVGCGGEPRDGEAEAAAAEEAPAGPVEGEAVGAVTDSLLAAGHRGRPSTWPTYGGDWAQTRYSPLEEIDRGSVGRLRPAWIHQTGVVGTFECTPIVLGREMYVTTPADEGRQKVIRLDAATGAPVWEVELEARGESRTAASEDLHLPVTFGPHRGAAVYGDRVYLGTLNGTLLALDRETGRRAFEVETLSPRLTGAPLAARGRIIVGLSWVDRGAVQAFDAGTGEHLWTWHTIPSPEEGGWWGEWAETLPGRPEIGLGRDIAREKADSARLAETWRTGGGSAPMTPSFDPERGLVFVSVGGPDPTAFPPPHEPHPGDMRWTNSICALRIETGRPAWCRQFLPHDIWGASGPSPPFLLRTERDGEVVDAVARFTALGNLYVWTRDGGPIRVSENYVPVPETVGGAGGANLIRGGVAGTIWSPGAYDPSSGLAYSTNRLIPGYFQPREEERKAGQYGNVAAVDTRTGRVVWRARTERPLAGGALVTAGGLVFAGRTGGYLDAYDARTGERLWEFYAGAGCNSAPVTYRLGGRQYVAASCGGHGLLDPRGGDAVIAFTLVPS